MTGPTPQPIPEIIRYKIPPNETASFESAYRRAGVVLQASSNCQGYELIRSDKDAQNYILTIFWDSSEGHLEGFRKSDPNGQYLSANPLRAIGTASSDWVRTGRRVVTDGPFVETREQLGSHFLTHAWNRDEAIALAAQPPMAGVIEVRPVAEIPESAAIRAQ